MLLLAGYRLAAQQTTNLDSIRAANKHRIDSMRAAQQLRADSIAAIRAYKTSKGYKDSVALVRQIRRDSIVAERTRMMDSIRTVRERIQDSVRAVTIARNDSLRRVNDSIRAERIALAEKMRAERKRISDSLGAIRAYKQSPQYKDSVATIRQNRIDSIRAVRLAYSDSVRAAQRHILDSIKTERKRYADSLRTAQQAFNDSMKAERIRIGDSLRLHMEEVRAENARIRDSAIAARKVISDSLAKVREARALEREKKLEEKKKKKELALELKFEQEKKSYTNDKFKKKKWTPPRKILQNTFTRYNYYYNANLKLKEAETNMRRVRKDNYDEQISLFPFNPDTDSAKLKSDMDTIIQKTSLGIQLHDPRGKWQDDLYLIMGQAYYYKGDYENAANAFKFIIHEAEEAKKEKRKKDKNEKKDLLAQNSFADIEPEGLAAIIKHNPSKNEAILWLARVLVKQQEATTAQLLLDMLKNDVNFPQQLKPRLDLEYANLALETGKLNAALQPLMSVLHTKQMDKYIRMRAGYIAAQIYQEQGLLEESSVAYEKVVDLYPSLEMDFNARMNVVRNSLQSDTGTHKVYTTLTKMSKDQKFKPYFDQVYYGLGKHFEAQGDVPKALEHYNKSIASGSNNVLQKGITYVGLGDMYYKSGDHLVAAQKYDSAVQFLTPENNPYYTHANTRSSSLYLIAAPARIVKETDSLLHLSGLSSEEQRAHVRAYLKDLEKQRIDSYYVSQNAPVQQIPNNTGGNKSWYFANAALMQKGANEFKQKWPNRELKDNWRRSNLSGGEISEDDNIVTENLTPEELIRKNLPSEDSLLLAIPNRPQMIDSLSEARQVALYNLGKGYFYTLEDYDNTFITFDKLDSLYPENEFVPETYYIKYLIRMRQQKPDDAMRYYNYLTKNYPNNTWTVQMINAGKSSENDTAISIDKHYDKAYNTIMGGDYQDGLQQVQQAYTKFQVMGKYKKQYDLLKVIALAGLQDYKQAEVLVNDWIKNNTNDSLRDYALTLKAFIAKNINVQKDSLDALNVPDTLSGTLKDDPPAGDKVPENTLSIYTKPDGKSKYYALLLMPLDARIQGVKAGLNEYNNITKGHEGITVSLNALSQKQSILLLKEFDNEKDARSYINKVLKLNSLFSEYNDKSQIKSTTISINNYPKLLSSKDVGAYLDFWRRNYK